MENIELLLVILLHNHAGVFRLCCSYCRLKLLSGRFIIIGGSIHQAVAIDLIEIFLFTL